MVLSLLVKQIKRTSVYNPNFYKNLVVLN